MGTLRIGRRSVQVSKLDKVLFPESGLTKGDLIDHYRLVADRMLPHLAERPVVLQRFPDGIEAGGFYQKQVQDHYPDWIDSVRVPLKKGGHQRLVRIEDAATLVTLADQACLTFHPWLSRAGRLARPDRMIFDLDPPDDDFGPVRSAGRALKALLDEVGLATFAQTTGSRGLHVVVPIRPEQDFDAVRAFARDLADALVARHPDDLTTAQRKDARGGRLFIDTNRNAYGQTAVAPYAVRARPGATLATPIEWSELDAGRLDARRYRIDNLGRRLARRADPWKGMGRHARSLRRPRERLDALQEGKD